ncbi:ABC transporter [Sistotremastrum suecicum HHB10207 ss-3]|uniref:ABC transporter n=1 Tax=Sistotremastrum suecicum HHB10207 ss-3 TaxID=1314776 RepID=A0A166G291_9AGAM|nr:ABC transporter [Sistotremastrum suecicum HHB10207 ss-3]
MSDSANDSKITVSSLQVDSPTADKKIHNEPELLSQTQQPELPSKGRLAIICSVFALSLFLTSLDQTIVSTAIPSIASHFDSLSQVTWIPGAYFLTQSGFLLVAGQVLTVFPTKTVYIASVALFEVGSLICAVSQSMNLLIFGRAIAGLGASGISPAVTAVLVEITRLEDRPMIIGLLGINLAMGIIIGPLLGGVFTDHISWRWCFYINLPLGGIAILTILFLLRVPPSQDQRQSTTWKQKLQILDIPGSLFCIGTTVCLLLALQWGGTSKRWNSPTIIALLSLLGVLVPALAFCEWKRGMHAILPFAMLRRRSQIGATFQAFFIGLGLFVGVYYIPLWYQAQGHTATRSGIDLLPYLMTTIGVAGISGAVINHFGRYWHALVISPLVFSVGSGLLSTIGPESSLAKLVGFQVICGIGIGGALQNTYLVPHAEYDKEKEHIAQGSAIVMFAQLIGGLLGISVAGALFENQLARYLHLLVPDLSPETAAALHQSVSVIFTLPDEVRRATIEAYVQSLDKVFLIGVPVGFLASVSGMICRDYNVKTLSTTNLPV